MRYVSEVIRVRVHRDCVIDNTLVLRDTVLYIKEGGVIVSYTKVFLSDGTLIGDIDTKTLKEFIEPIVL